MFKHISLALLSVVAFAQITPIPGGGGSGGSGTVTSIATGCGLSGGPITGAGTIVSRYVENAQIGTTYTVLAGDCGKAVTFSNAAAIAVTLPQAGVSFPDGWFFYAKNIGAGVVTITPTTSTISGAASITLEQGEWAVITSNGTNYQSMTSRVAIGSGLAKATSEAGVTLNTAPEVLTLTNTSTVTNKTLISPVITTPTITGISFTTETDGATITWAIGSRFLANAQVTLGGTRTLNLTGLVNGGSYVLTVIQDGTGGHGLTLGTGCTWKVSGGGTGAITPTTAANAIDVLAFTYDGTNCYANFAKNFN